MLPSHALTSALTPEGSGESTLSCDIAFTVVGSAVVLSSPLVMGEWVTCIGSSILSASDINDLERDSSTSATAVDAYNFSVGAIATTHVAFEQVCWYSIADPESTDFWYKITASAWTRAWRVGLWTNIEYRHFPTVFQMQVGFPFPAFPGKCTITSCLRMRSIRFVLPC